MATEEKKQPIIVKKVRKADHGRHGGAWKVAYADFVTAMMAFFLLLWLLETTTMEQRAGISKFFQQPSMVTGPGGASTSMIKLGGSVEIPHGEGEPLKGGPTESQETIVRDSERLDDLMERLKQQIEETPSLRDFKDQLFLDITSEGLRIEIVDNQNRPMFDLASARLKWYTVDILHELAPTLNLVPNYISVTGHTDALQYGNGRTGYGNWELSTDRANAARRELNVGGIDQDKFGRIVGFGDSILFDKENPMNPMNRRIAIVVLNKAMERVLGLPPLAEEPPAEESEQAKKVEEPASELKVDAEKTPAAEPEPAPPVPEPDPADTLVPETLPEVPAELLPVRRQIIEPLREAIEAILGPPPEAD